MFSLTKMVSSSLQPVLASQRFCSVVGKRLSNVCLLGLVVPVLAWQSPAQAQENNIAALAPIISLLLEEDGFQCPTIPEEMMFDPVFSGVEPTFVSDGLDTVDLQDFISGASVGSPGVFQLKNSLTS